MNNNIRKLKEVDFYYWLRNRQDKTLIVSCDGIEVESSTEILKEVIDNIVLDMQIDRSNDKVFIKIEDEEKDCKFNWITTYVA